MPGRFSRLVMACVATDGAGELRCWWTLSGGQAELLVQASILDLGSHTSRPLLIHDRPWKMISMYFIVELPPSEGLSALFHCGGLIFQDGPLLAPL